MTGPVGVIAREGEQVGLVADWRYQPVASPLPTKEKREYFTASWVWRTRDASEFTVYLITSSRRVYRIDNVKFLSDKPPVGKLVQGEHRFLGLTMRSITLEEFKKEMIL